LLSALILIGNDILNFFPNMEDNNPLELGRAYEAN